MDEISTKKDAHTRNNLKFDPSFSGQFEQNFYSDKTLMIGAKLKYLKWKDQKPGASYVI